MLDRAVPPSKAKLRHCRRRVLNLAGDELLRFDLPPAPDPGPRFTMFAPISTHVADAAAPSSVEAFLLDHIRAELPRVTEARKRVAIERASVMLTLSKDDRELIAAAFPHGLSAPDEELAVAVLGVMIAKALARFHQDTLTAIRRFPPRLRGLVKMLIAAADGSLVKQRAELMAAAPVGALDPQAFETAAGVRDLLKQMHLPKAAAKLRPSAVGAASRFSKTTMHAWSHNPQLLGLFDHRSLQQRRQAEFDSRLAAAILGHTGIGVATAEAMLHWATLAAPEIAAGRFGSKYVRIVRWIVDSGSRRGVRPRRKWTAKISFANALAASHEHAETLRAARRRYVGVSLPADDPPAEGDQWPRGGDLGEGLSLRRLWTLAVMQRVGRLLNNCLEYSSCWERLHQTNAATVYALLEGAEVVGAIALGRDLIGALSIIEQGGPSNAPLPARIERPIQKWVGQANAGAGKTATDQP